jgi:hypothetical protein
VVRFFVSSAVMVLNVASGNLSPMEIVMEVPLGRMDKLALAIAN